MDGALLNVIFTSSVDKAQEPLLTVHLKVYGEPAVPLKLDIALKAFPNEPLMPLMILQLPVPIAGAFPASVTDVNPQVVAPVWSIPAFEVVGV